MNLENVPFAIIGISHHTAPVQVRGEVALNVEDQKITLEYLKKSDYTQGCIVLSTCNRTEIYLSSENIEQSVIDFKDWFSNYKQCDYFNNADYTYVHSGVKAVEHFFKVISSLDSQIVGETQITGQVKEAYNLALEMHATDSLINKIFNFGIQAQKDVRNSTYLCAGAVSISFAGVELAEKIFNKLEDKKVLLFGAGETAELAADHFSKKGVRQFHVINRTYEKAESLAKLLNGKAFSLDQMDDAFEGVDIVISATSSTEHVITFAYIKQLGRKRRNTPLFLIDLAIPRDIDPAIEKLQGVYLYNLDDLQEIVKINTSKRTKEIPKALKSIDDVMQDWVEWYGTYSLSSTIGKLKNYFEQVCTNEINRALKAIPEDSTDPCDFDVLKTNLINKLVRQHIKLLKKTNGNPDYQQTHINLIHDLFELEK